jgi:hypothetical protein
LTFSTIPSDSPATSLSLNPTLDGVIKIAQLDNAPGFEAQATIGLNYPADVPRFNLDVGYLHVDTRVEQTAFVGFDFGLGLKFDPAKPSLNINAQAIFSNDPTVGEKVQKVVSALYQGGATPSSFGISGLKFGPDSSIPIITFSGIVFDKSLGSLGGFGSSNKASTNALLKINDAELEVSSSSDITLSFGSEVSNPWPISLDLGSISLSTTLDQDSLMGIQVAPISIGTGNFVSNFAINLKTAVDDGALAAKVAEVFKAVSTGSASSIVPGIGNLIFTPRSNNPNAVIRQLQGLKFTLPLTGAQSGSSFSSSILDLSAITPKGMNRDLISKVSGIQFDTLSNLKVVAGANIDYLNPVAVTASLPYVGFFLNLDQYRVTEGAISGISIQRNQGLILF